MSQQGLIHPLLLSPTLPSHLNVIYNVHVHKLVSLFSLLFFPFKLIPSPDQLPVHILTSIWYQESTRSGTHWSRIVSLIIVLRVFSCTVNRRKKEASKVKQTDKAKQHSTPKAVTFLRKNELPRVGLEPTTLYTLDRVLYQLSYQG